MTQGTIIRKRVRATDSHILTEAYKQLDRLTETELQGDTVARNWWLRTEQACIAYELVRRDRVTLEFFESRPVFVSTIQEAVVQFALSLGDYRHFVDGLDKQAATHEREAQAGRLV